MEIQSIYCYNKKEFNPQDFLVLKKTIYENFVDVVGKNKDGEFVKVIEKNQVVIKSYNEFYLDVAALQNFFLRLDQKTIVTRNSNLYIHLVQILSAILSGKTLCLLSPHDSDFEVERKLSLLSSDYWLADNEFCQKIILENKVNTNILQKIPTSRIMIQVFTSGSTGYNKIVCLSEANVMTNAEALARHHKLSTQDIICTALPVFHVNCLGFSFLSNLMAGGRLVLFDYFNIFDFYNEIKKSNVTIASIIPDMLFQFTKAKKYFKQNEIPSLKYFVSAASYLSSGLLDEFQNYFKIKIVQGYGLSEAVNFSVTMPIDLAWPQHLKVGINDKETSIGNELYGNEVLILDNAYQEVAEEKIGELGIRGWNVMLGYFNKSDGKPHLESNSVLMTGDLGYFKLMNNKKYFYITGRKKDIVKIKGESVSLRQIDDFIQAFCDLDKDMISFGYQSTEKFESIGLVVKSNTKIKCQSEFQKIFDALESTNKNLKISLVLLTEKSIRTSSGKPIRWRYSQFVEQESFKNQSSQETIFDFDEMSQMTVANKEKI